jgi:hypothetical protein
LTNKLNKDIKKQQEKFDSQQAFDKDLQIEDEDKTV